VEFTPLNRFYGHGALIRAAAEVPEWVPLPFAVQHGWFCRAPLATSAELVSGLPAVWAWNGTVARQFCELDAVTIVGGAPFLYACDRVGSCRAPGARGTLVLPTHGSRHVRLLSDYDRYLAQLAALPAEFHPMVFCLHPNDLGGALHRELRRRRLDVVTNGASVNPDYLVQFIRHTSAFRYATSNVMATALLYAAHVGLAAFVYGPKVDFENVSDRHLPRGPICAAGGVLDSVTAVFSLEAIDNLKAQQEAAAEQLGVSDRKTGREIRDALRATYRQVRATSLVRASVRRIAAQITGLRERGAS
jgi:hypothetical protein